MVKAQNPKIQPHRKSEGLFARQLPKFLLLAMFLSLAGNLSFVLLYSPGTLSSFNYRLVWGLVGTLGVALIWAWSRYTSNHVSTKFTALHLWLLFVPIAEAIAFGSRERDVWTSVVLLHGLASIGLVYNRIKAIVVACFFAFSLPVAWYLDVNLTQDPYKFSMLFISLTAFCFVEFAVERFFKQYFRRKRRLGELAEQNETGLRILSHDMANIMSVVKENLEMGLEDIYENPGQLKNDTSHFFEESHRATVHGIGILNAVKDFIAILSGKRDPGVETFYLHDVLDDVLKIWSKTAGRKGITIAIETSLTRSDCLVAGSRPIFTHTIVGNLMSNAIKFSPEKSSITLCLKRADEFPFLNLEVKDQGKGMSDEKIMSVFDTKAVTTSPGTSGEKGTGFGLPLVKRALLMFGGDIEAYSLGGTRMGERIGCRFVCKIRPAQDFVSPTAHSVENLDYRHAG